MDLLTFNSVLDDFGNIIAERPNAFVLTAHRPPEDWISLWGDRLLTVTPSSEVMTSLAAGLARTGKEVWCIAPAWELISQAYNALRCLSGFKGLPVRFVSTASGLTGSPLGASTQVLEDLALMRALPDMTVLVPSDKDSARFLLHRASQSSGAVYLRLPSALSVEKVSRPVPLSDENWCGMTLAEGNDVTICACGIMVREAIEASRVLDRQGMSAGVVDILSPTHLPEDAVLSSVRRTGCLVSVEEGCSAGGLGEALASLLCTSYPAPLISLAVKNQAGQSGQARELLEYYGLSSRDIVSAAVQVWAMRRR